MTKNAPKPKQTVAAKEVELIETENTEDSPNENPIAAEDTIPVIEEQLLKNLYLLLKSQRKRYKL